MPLAVMEQRLAVASDWDDFVWHMKVPEWWVRFRLALVGPPDRARLDVACRWADWTLTA
jgi:hypothetical protein